VGGGVQKGLSEGRTNAKVRVRNPQEKNRVAKKKAERGKGGGGGGGGSLFSKVLAQKKRTGSGGIAERKGEGDRGGTPKTYDRRIIAKKSMKQNICGAMPGPPKDLKAKKGCQPGKGLYNKKGGGYLRQGQWHIREKVKKEKVTNRAQVEAIYLGGGSRVQLH